MVNNVGQCGVLPKARASDAMLAGKGFVDYLADEGTAKRSGQTLGPLPRRGAALKQLNMNRSDYMIRTRGRWRRAAPDFRHRWGSLAIIAVASLAGLAGGMYLARTPPWPLQWARQLARRIPIALGKAPPESELPILTTPAEIRKMVTFDSDGAIERRRQALKESLHGARCLRDNSLRVVTSIEGPSKRTPSRQLRVALPLGFEARTRLFTSTPGAKTLAIYSTGHAGPMASDYEAIATLLRADIDVVALDMPLIGHNPRPKRKIEGVGTVQFTSHDQLELLASSDFDPLVLFVEPISCLINHFVAMGQYSTFVQVGFSGGGFVATLAAALDPRISKTFSVAGQSPMFLRFANPRTDHADYEQASLVFRHALSDLELYVMAAHGPRREYAQVYNEFDPCCYAGRGHTLYASVVQESVSRLGPGRFEVWSDTTNPLHSISARTTAAIVESIRNR